MGNTTQQAGNAGAANGQSNMTTAMNGQLNNDQNNQLAGASAAQRQQTQALLRATLDSTAEGILVVSQAGKITGYNRRFMEMWRVPESILALQETT